MTRVIDASVALKWYLPEPDSPVALNLLTSDESLVAPDLIVPEICRAVWKAWKRQEITADQAASIARNVGRRFVTTLSPTTLLAYRATALSAELDHSTYDCFYLALAEREGTHVLTADHKLLRKIAATRYASLARPLV